MNKKTAQKDHWKSWRKFKTSGERERLTEQLWEAVGGRSADSDQPAPPTSPKPPPRRVLLGSSKPAKQRRGYYKGLASGIETYKGGVPRDFPFKLHEVYSVFNHELFDGALPPISIKIEKLTGSVSTSGQVFGTAWSGRKSQTPELILMGRNAVPIHAGEPYLNISLDLNHIETTEFQSVLATFVHEMCHIYEYEYFPGEVEPHPESWGLKMQEIGLMPSSTGKPGGAMTGEHVLDYIISGGRFDTVSCRMIDKWSDIQFV